jgi:hypothetical protein
MSDPLQTLTPGERPGPGKGPFNAAFHNRAIDAINLTSRRSATLRGPDRLNSDRDQSIWISNAAGQDLAQFGIVGLGALLSDPATAVGGQVTFENQTAFSSAVPAAASPFAILLDPIPEGAANIGRAILVGAAKCTIDVADASHQWAAPIAGNYAKLASQAEQGPARILWKQSGTGEKLAIVRIGETGGSAYHFGLSITPFTAATHDAPGVGILEYYTANFQRTGVFGLGLNACGIIPAGWWLDVHREPFDQMDMVTPRCERVPEGSDSSISDSSGSDVPVDCCDWPDVLPFRWTTDNALFSTTVVEGNLVKDSFDNSWNFIVGIPHGTPTLAPFTVQIKMFCDPDTNKMRIGSATSWGASFASSAEYSTSEAVDCDNFCFRGDGVEYKGGGMIAPTQPQNTADGAWPWSSHIVIGDCAEESDVPSLPGSDSGSGSDGLNETHCEDAFLLTTGNTATYSMSDRATQWFRFPAVASDILSIKWDHLAGASPIIEVLTGTCPDGLVHAFNLSDFGSSGCYVSNTPNWGSTGLYIRIPNTSGGIISGRIRIDKPPDCVTGL